jgi:hypothetical protein
MKNTPIFDRRGEWLRRRPSENTQDMSEQYYDTEKAKVLRLQEERYLAFSKRPRRWRIITGWGGHFQPSGGNRAVSVNDAEIAPWLTTVRSA